MKENAEPAETQRNHETTFIEKERRRQKRRGFGPRHDDKHRDKAIIDNAIDVLKSYRNSIYAPDPTSDKWGLGRKHHGNPLKLLAVAGALIVAEHGRITRATKTPPSPRK